MNIALVPLKDMTPMSLEEMYPGLSLSEDTDIESVIISLSAYTGCDGIDKEAILSTRSMGKKPSIKEVVPLWGVVSFWKEFTNPLTGEIDRVLSVVFRLEDTEGGEEQYASFSSVSVARFFEKSIRPLRPVGDWDRPLYAVFYKKSLPLGATYLCRLVPAPSVPSTIVED